MATTIAELERYCNEVLESERFQDASENGVQVDSDRAVTRLATGVSASEALLLEAARAGAQAVLVHHGIFWSGVSPVIRGGTRKRVSALLEHQMGLLAYHLPLDAHGELGNNIQLGRHLGLGGLTPWGKYHGMVIGYSGVLDPPLPVEQLVQKIQHLVGRPVLHLPGGPATVGKVAVVSGGGAMMAVDAARDGHELFLIGEPTESSMHFAAEEQMHTVAAGHHATETFGVRALGDRLASRFGIEVKHLELPNPV